MIMGVCGFAGGRNAMLGDRTNAKTVPSVGSTERCPEPTPVKVPVPERAGPRNTPTVMLQTSPPAIGDDEIE